MPPEPNLPYRRAAVPSGLVSFPVRQRESDLLVSAVSDCSRLARLSLRRHRARLERYIARDPGFLRALAPRPVRPDAPTIARRMADAGAAVGVGPMAAVAGAVAGGLAQDLLKVSDELIIENGGDIYIKSERDCVVGIFAGNSPLTGRVGIRVRPSGGLGIATSSGTVGHSLSFGRADACVVISPCPVLADAAATAFANSIREPDDLPRVLARAGQIPGLNGIILILGDRLALQGNGFRLVNLSAGDERTIQEHAHH